MAYMSRNAVIDQAVQNYLHLRPANSFPAPEDMESELIDHVNNGIALQNVGIPKDRKYKTLTTLPNYVIAQIICELYPVACLSLAGDSKELAMYVDKGAKRGLYVMDDDEIKRIATQYNKEISESDLNEVVTKIKRNAPEKELTKNPDLIAVNNGIFDYKAKTLLPFSPDMVFVSKSGVNYNPQAANVIIHNPEDGTIWDIENWMMSLSDDPQIINLLWELLGAIIRPNVAWNKSIWMYSPTGNNGKGTLCQLMRNLCGEDACDSISVSQFSNDVFLDKLMHVSAIIADENPPGTYLDGAENLKAAITGDPIVINRKYRSKVKFIFRGIIVECINDFPKMRDRTLSFLRRLLIIPMTKCFTGHERKYIKEDYLKRPEVLEYVLKKVLNTNYYCLSEPQACKNMLAEYREYNDPVVEFWNTFSVQFVWDLLPYSFLYDLYKAWHNDSCPAGKLLSKNKFCSELRTVISGNPDWEAPDTPRNRGKKMDAFEPLIEKYNLQEWQDHSYKGFDRELRYRPRFPQDSYRGLVRCAPVSNTGCVVGNENEEERR